MSAGKTKLGEKRSLWLINQHLSRILNPQGTFALKINDTPGEQKKSKTQGAGLAY